MSILRNWLNSLPTWLRGSLTTVLLVGLYAGALALYLYARGAFSAGCQALFRPGHELDTVALGLLSGLVIPGSYAAAALAPNSQTQGTVILVACATLGWAIAGALVGGRSSLVKVLGWLLLFGFIALDVLAGAVALYAFAYACGGD